MGGLRRFDPVPVDLRDVVEKARQAMRSRESYSEQTRDYHINCQNGDQVDIHETIKIWTREIE